nr:immunoglobulin lambda-1 light chain-like [Anolis sagrei ordinatus]
MAWTLLFLVLLDFYAGVHSQGMLTQPSLASGSPGQTITLSCTKSSGNWNSEVYWIKEKSGEAPRIVHCNGCSRGEGIPDRFTATGSGNTGSLTITNVQAEDEANYYCICYSSTVSVYHSGPFSWGICKSSNLDLFFAVMAWASLLLLLLMYCSGIASQPTLTQVPSQSVTLGNTVRLTTTVSRDHEYHAVSWYQQREGQAPRFLLDTSNNRGSGTPDRFSGSKPGREGYLTITNVLAEDEATYYCVASYHGSGSGYM